MSKDQIQYGPNASLDGHDVDLASADRLIESLRQQLEGAHELIRLIFESTPPYREDGSNIFSDSVIEKWKELLP